jgi:hypothetical protein
MAEKVRTSIGFEGGQVLAVRLDPDELKKLREALASGGWHELPIEDGTATIYVGKVVYIRTESDEQRVGFGIGG